MRSSRQITTDRLAALFALLLFALTISPVPADAQTDPGPLIEDSALRAAIRAELYLADQPDSQLTIEALGQISSITARRKGIESLVGLEYCTSLVRLDLTDNNITDLQPLAGLTRLQSVNVAGNQISDLSPLTGLSLLNYLDLSRNSIEDISPLGGLRALGSLDLAENHIQDISPVRGLHSLWFLDLSRNRVDQIEALADLTGLVLLELDENQIHDISPLSKLYGLRSLSLNDNQITDVSPLVRLAAEQRPEGGTRYWRVSLEGNPLVVDDPHVAQLADYSLYVGFGPGPDTVLSGTTESTTTTSVDAKPDDHTERN